MTAPGRTQWVIAEGYLPSRGLDDEALKSHETFCILNAGTQDAHLQITLFFADRDPVGPYRVTVPAQRTKHLRANELDDPEVPRDTDYATLIESDAPVVVQHTRLDSRPENFTIFSTMAYPG